MPASRDCLCCPTDVYFSWSIGISLLVINQTVNRVSQVAVRSVGTTFVSVVLWNSLVVGHILRYRGEGGGGGGNELFWFFFFLI